MCELLICLSGFILAERDGLFKVDQAGRLMMWSPKHKRYVYFEEWYLYQVRFAEKRLPRLRSLLGKITAKLPF